jgi:hypothetical protein
MDPRAGLDAVTNRFVVQCSSLLIMGRCRRRWHHGLCRTGYRRPFRNPVGVFGVSILPSGVQDPFALVVFIPVLAPIICVSSFCMCCGQYFW